MKSNKLVAIQIQDQVSLLEACDILHDARFDLSKAKFDAQTGVWSAVFIREFFEDPALMQEQDRLLVTRFTFPMAECTLELSGLKGCDVQDRSRIGTYTFNECQPSANGYRLVFCENMEIVFTVHGEPKGKLRDVKLLNELGSYWSFRNPFRKRLTRASKEKGSEEEVKSALGS